MRDNQARTNLRSSQYSSISYLEVGPEQKRFGVPTNVLVQGSPYFRAAFSGSFAEAATGVMKLPEDDPEIVSFFVTWLYTRRCQRETMPGARSADLDRGDIFRLYIFADAKSVRRLQWHIIHELVVISEQRFLAPRDVKYVYENTPFNVIATQASCGLALQGLQQ